MASRQDLVLSRVEGERGWDIEREGEEKKKRER